MRTLEEILAMPEVERKIYYLKKDERPSNQTLTLFTTTGIRTSTR